MVKETMAVLERIKHTNSRNGKERILSEFVDNEKIGNALRFLCNDLIVTGISNKKISKETGVLLDKHLNSIQEVMDWLIKHNTGRDLDVELVRDFIHNHAESDIEVEFLEEFFTKKYKLGVTAKTLNKIFGENGVPEFGVQLAFDIEKAGGINALKGEFFVTEKLDGQRLVALVNEDGKVDFYSRSGKIQTGLVEIGHEVVRLAQDRLLALSMFNKGFVLDGEVLASDPTIPNDKLCAETISIMSSKAEEKTGLAYHVFDILPLDEFFKGKSSELYADRRAHLETLIKPNANYDVVRVVPLLYSGDDTDSILFELDFMDSQGKEGVMVNLNDYYVTKRSKSLIKFKTFNSVDLEVVEIFEGEGALKGSLGGIVVDYKGNNVRVGTGFDFLDRAKNKAKDWVGKVVEIKYFEESRNKKDNSISLRFPVFMRVRDDKTVEDLENDNE